MKVSFVVMAGGSGTRFWPASRKKMPKQFLNIVGDDEMVKLTVRRIVELSEDTEVVLVINEEHADLVRRILKDYHIRLMTEPVGRNTAPCIGLAAMFLNREDPDQSLIILPADHYVADEISFRRTIATAAKLAKSGNLVTIGIPPTRPETGYGYIQQDIQTEIVDDFTAVRVKRFVEKPDLKTATQYIESRNYFWNAGIFAFTPRVILKEIEKHLPEAYEQLMIIQESVGKGNYQKILRECYDRMPNISIDYGIMEKTDLPIYAIPGDFGWSDVGHWESLFDLRSGEHDAAGNLVQGKAEVIDTKETFVYNKTKQLIVAAGLEDILIVNTDDVVFVGKRQDAEKMRHVVDTVKKNNGDRYL